MSLIDRAQRATDLARQQSEHYANSSEPSFALWIIAMAIFHLDATINLAADEIVRAIREGLDGPLEEYDGINPPEERTS